MSNRKSKVHLRIRNVGEFFPYKYIFIIPTRHKTWGEPEYYTYESYLLKHFISSSKNIEKIDVIRVIIVDDRTKKEEGYTTFGLKYGPIFGADSSHYSSVGEFDIDIIIVLADGRLIESRITTRSEAASLLPLMSETRDEMFADAKDRLRREMGTDIYTEKVLNSGNGQCLLSRKIENEDNDYYDYNEEYDNREDVKAYSQVDDDPSEINYNNEITPSNKNIPDLLGQVVIHKSFGEGIVRNIDDTFIYVAFSIGEKKFHFPDVFNSFLSAKSPLIAEHIALHIKEKDKIEKQQKEQVAVEKKRKSPRNSEVQYDVDDGAEDIILEDVLNEYQEDVLYEYQSYVNEDREMDFGYLED